MEEIIEDYFKITRGRLVDKIDKLDHTNKLDDNTISTLQSLRQIGNIGAHMEKRSNEIIRLDNPEEANILLKMIEILFDHTYVSIKKNKKTEDMVQEIKDKYKNSNK